MRVKFFFTNCGGARHLATRALDRRPCLKTCHASRVRSLLCETRTGVPFPVQLPRSESAPRCGFAGVDHPRPLHCTKALSGSVAVGFFSPVKGCSNV